jgi:pSer/pThr/pTyr-binding forkhead associated (FHA) protein
MQVILKPVSHPELGEIVIRDRLFPIGRHEPPFSGFGPEAVARLSRRHARLFEQDGAVYLVDLGSLNGTSVNGTPLDKLPRQLAQNDEISFAGDLTYRTELLGKSATGAAVGPESAGVVLTLTPEHPESAIEPLVVSEFPFLVSKSDDAFSRYRDRFPDEFTFLSRRHAHIFARDQNLLIEDLGSTNGTFVCGNRLDEHALTLHEGDTIAFGGDHFLYRVHIKRIDREAGRPVDDPGALTEALTSPEDIARTTFVTSANSFIDIFCIDNADEQGAEETPQDEADPANAGKDKSRGEGGGAAKPGGKPGRASIFLRELRRAFFDQERPAGRRLAWGSLVAVVVLSGLVALSYFQGAPKRDIERLLDEHAYLESAQRADRYLSRHPDDEDVAKLATEAVLGYAVPDWARQLEAGEFAAARATVTEARALSTHNPSARAMLGILDWIADLEEFIQERGGPDGPIVVFEHEGRMDELLRWWDRDANENQRLAGRIARYQPAFDPARARAFSHLRTLRSEKSLYLAAIDELKAELRARLGNGDIEDLDAALAEFEGKYPRISGVDALRQDARSYRLLSDALGERDWTEASALLDRSEFATPPFRQKVATIRSERLPPPEIALQYRKASQLWRDGQDDEAIAILESLTEGTWGTVAQEALEHKRAVRDRYRALIRSKQGNRYAESLLAFFGSLDPEEDVHFVDALKPDFQRYRDQAVERARQAFRDARKAWETYQSKGRILGLQRLEARISNKFRDLAEQLTEAYGHAKRGADLYDLLNIDYPSDEQALYQSVLRECRLQRRSLQELRMVLEPGLLRGKLELLPDPDAKAPAATQATPG